MAAPFCTGCGATIADGTRFCTKCGQPVGHTAPPPPPAFQSSAPLSSTVPPPPPPPTISQAAQYQAAQDPIGLYPPPPVKKGGGAGVLIGIFGLVLLVAGAGLWFYTTRIRASQAASAVQVAGTPTAPTPAAPADPVTPAPAPAPSAAPEVVPPNPDFEKKDQQPTDPSKKSPSPKSPSQATERPIQVQAPPRPPEPVPAPGPVKPASPTSGNLHASVEVAQYGEVVFENLPGGRLKFSFDHSAWQPTIHRQTNGTQTLVMRSLKTGIQRTCDVRWELVE